MPSLPTGGDPVPLEELPDGWQGAWLPPESGGLPLDLGVGGKASWSQDQAATMGAALRAWADSGPPSQGAQVLRRMPGRVTFAIELALLGPVGSARRPIPNDDAGASDGPVASDLSCTRRVVIKSFEGPLSGERWYSRLWRADGRSPAQREFESLLALQQRGLPVPRPWGWLARGNSSLVVMEYIDHEQTVRDALEADPNRWPRWRRWVLRIVSSLHGVEGRSTAVHRDLYLQHWLLATPGDLPCLIDVGRLLQGERLRRRWLEKDLAALAHSCPPAIGDRQRLAWLGAYLRRRYPGEPRSRARQRLWAWARRIERRRKRMAAHRPRHGEEPMGAEPPGP